MRHSPSHIWRSLKESIFLVKDGMFCKIGDSCKTQIWRDNWLPTPTTFRVQSPIRVLNKNALVESLINHNTKTWNSQLSGQIFNEEATTISNLPLSLFGAADKVT